MNVETGTRLGPYEIVAPIGAGGNLRRARLVVDRESRLISVPLLHTAAGIDVGAPTRHMVIDTIDYVLAADGQFVITSRAATAAPQPLIVTTNWSGKR